MAEIQADESKRRKHVERLRTKYPDKKFEDDEEIFGQISDDYDQYEAENSAYKEHERAFSDMFHSNPRSARLMMDWKDGKDPVSSLIRIYGKEEIMAAIDDPSRLEAIEEANKEFAERVAKDKEYEAEFDRNFPESARAIDEWASAQGISDETVDQLAEKLAEISSNFMVGKFTPETFEMLMKATNYDSDVENARGEGEVAGRNAKITENLRQSRKGDGLQNLNGRNNTGGGSPEKRGKSMFDWAQEAM